ncbi:MAG: hypothetical protein CM1200mP41_20160 [Gammaproteobacteria bacterium]|nr:MAG: hypothetical protein CM1200mP41_20160 [Gammaproteobacteria bacterium]
MGRDISLCFAVEGADLVLAGRRRKPLESLVDEVRALGDARWLCRRMSLKKVL